MYGLYSSPGRTLHTGLYVTPVARFHCMFIKYYTFEVESLLVHPIPQVAAKRYDTASDDGAAPCDLPVTPPSTHSTPDSAMD